MISKQKLVSLKGKRILLHKRNPVEIKVIEVAPSGKYVRIQYDNTDELWVSVADMFGDEGRVWRSDNQYAWEIIPCKNTKKKAKKINKK